jgi:hypothetical protein
MLNNSFVRKFQNITTDDAIKMLLTGYACLYAVGYFIRSCKK